MIDPLLEAVDALTGPQKTVILQDGLKPITIIRPSLLEQLGAAVYSSSGRDGESKGGSAFERNVLDSEAEYKFRIILSAIRDWAKIRGLAHVFQELPADMLRRWYHAHVAQAEHEDSFYVREIWSWVHLIERKLDPPKRKEITDPCPICGADKWIDNLGNVFRFPVLIEYRDVGPADETANLDDTVALCRSCDRTWKGELEIRKLRWDLKVNDAGT